MWGDRGCMWAGGFRPPGSRVSEPAAPLMSEIPAPLVSEFSAPLSAELSSATFDWSSAEDFPPDL